VKMPAPPSLQSASIRIWDAPVRIVHWAMALLLPLAWWAAEAGHMVWHYRFGFALLGLLVFRLIWGFAGSSTARFASFVRSPRRVIAYLRGGKDHIHGHNPLGGLSIVALLAVLALQIGLGLFAENGNGRKAGPFADLIAPGAAHAAGKLHQANFYLLLALIGLHIAAVLFYLLVRRDNLITPMLTGRRPAPAGTRSVTTAPAARLFLAAAIAAGVALWLIAGS
jgi:cytochrome b